MTAFARKVLGGLPAPNVAGAANNYSILQEFTNDTDKAGGKVDLQVSPDAVAVRPLRLARASTPTISRRFRCPPAAAATATSTRATSSSCSARPTSPSDRSLLEVRFGWSNTQGGKNPPALGEAGHASASPGCRPTRASPAACRRRAITGYSAFGRQATNPQWQYPDGLQSEGQLHVADGQAVAQGRLRVPAHQRRGAGREPALRPRHATPASSRGRRARRRTTSTTSPTSCSACGRSTRSARSSSPTCGRTCTSCTCRTTSASTTS